LNEVFQVFVDMQNKVQKRCDDFHGEGLSLCEPHALPQESKMPL
jgi:hypothetical protein